MRQLGEAGTRAVWARAGGAPGKGLVGICAGAMLCAWLLSGGMGWLLRRVLAVCRRRAGVLVGRCVSWVRLGGDGA